MTTRVRALPASSFTATRRDAAARENGALGDEDRGARRRGVERRAAREAGRDGRAGQLERRRVRVARGIGAGRHLDDGAGQLGGDAVDPHGELLPGLEARRGDGAGRDLHDEAAARRGLDRDERAARGREVAGLDEARGHTAGERRRHAGLACDGGGCFHRAFALLDGALRLLVLHPGHVELERRRRARGREGLVAFVVALGEGERRAGLRERALGLGVLALSRSAASISTRTSPAATDWPTRAGTATTFAMTRDETAAERSAVTVP